MSLSAASAQDFFDHSEAEPQASTSAEEPSPQTETTTLPDDSDEEDHLEHHGHMDEHQKDEDTPPPEKSEKVLRFNIPEVGILQLCHFFTLSWSSHRVRGSSEMSEHLDRA
ncbi:hypothetical protein L596_010081 [Steinernema carpocapsae]|nr:hypothetical protein L596_010081 [Steinernema carpocapsae]